MGNSTSPRRSYFPGAGRVLLSRPDIPSHPSPSRLPVRLSTRFGSVESVGNAPVQFSFGTLHPPVSPPSLLLTSAGNPMDWLAPRSPDPLLFVGRNPREADRSMGSDVSCTISSDIRRLKRPVSPSLPKCTIRPGQQATAWCCVSLKETSAPAPIFGFALSQSRLSFWVWIPASPGSTTPRHLRLFQKVCW